MRQYFARTALFLLLLAVAAPAAAPVPRPAPPLRMKAMNGEDVSLYALRGKVVGVLFFSTDCSHCHEAAKVIIPLFDELHARGLEMIGVATNSKAGEHLQRFADLFHVQFPLGVGSRLDWARFGRFPVHSKPPYVPHLLFVDRSGVIRAEFRGQDRQFYDNLAERFRAVVEPLLDEPYPAKPFSD